jgi:NDP-sugar pyrophosphorylase family protein
MFKSATAIILAGSHAWHADSLEALCPRVLLSVANAPLISYTLEWLRAAQITEVAICANDASSALQDYLKAGTQHDLNIYYYEDRIPRAPAGCVRDAALIVPAEHFIVVDGSIIPTVDYFALRSAHVGSGAAVTVVSNVNQIEPESRDSGPRPVGIYMFDRRAMDYVPATGYQDIKEALIPRLHRDNESVVVFPVNRSAPRVLGLPSYFAAQAWLLERVQEGELTFEGYVYTGGIFIHETAHLSPRARIVGPVMIGPQSRVEDDALIIGPSVLGRDCVVERQAVVEQSVLWDTVVVGEQAIVDRCLITNGVVIEAGGMKRGVACSLDTPAVALNGTTGNGASVASKASMILRG